MAIGSINEMRNDLRISAGRNNMMGVKIYTSLLKTYDTRYISAFEDALLIAASNGYLDIVKFLSNQQGVDISTYNNGPLIAASMEGRLQIVMYITTHPRFRYVSNQVQRAITQAKAKGHTKTRDYLERVREYME